MPAAPRFTQKPSIQQTPQGDLLMECQLESDPPPSITWQHAGTPLAASARVIQTLDNLSGTLYKATLVIKEPNAGDGGAYRCTARNQLGESNANINLNFAGGGDDGQKKGPTFVGKPRIIPKDGGALILMDCRVKSATPPTARWLKDGVPLQMGGLYHAIFEDLGDNVYQCQLQIRGPSASDAGQYRCNIRNDQGETNANLALNFEEPDPAEEEQRRRERRERSHSRQKDAASPKPSSRPGSPKKSMRSREGTPKKRREGSEKKTMRSRTSTPVGDEEERRGSKVEKMDVDNAAAKRPPTGLEAPTEKKRRSASPKPAESTKSSRKANQPPLVVDPVLSKSGKPGDPIVLMMKWQCDQSTKITWYNFDLHENLTYRDGAPIGVSQDYTQYFDGEVAKLTIHELSEERSGSFKCVAESQHGKAQSSAMVKMEPGDDVPRRKSRVGGPGEDEERSQKKTASSLKADRDDEDERSESLAPPKKEFRRESKSKSPGPTSQSDELKSARDLLKARPKSKSPTPQPQPEKTQLKSRSPAPGGKDTRRPSARDRDDEASTRKIFRTLLTWIETIEKNY